MLLSATFLDPDAAPGDVSYSWACLGPAGGPCKAPGGGALQLASGSANQSVTLQGTALGSVYSFTLVASKGARSASASATVNATAGTLPLVSLAALPAAKANPTAKLTLQARSSEAPPTAQMSEAPKT